MAYSLHKDVAVGPGGQIDVTVSWMDDGSIKVRLPDGPWTVDSTITTDRGVTQVRIVKVKTED
jgi:hypothetical protein